ncbi:conserved Plasmodium protein, unknown function [Plasmodium gallinaceum]|uniref:Uncharacterized protein n=1 Tax=Plasmodium gallinaceum TaxID=5849 RepID=A0A1J1GQ63_PLAGA|nr:conserved Plasmodium protein, unknown function [Plasmodium gallinaceum]CRG94669.1 conserved Plasmodium protein, unknown function [Plasmodium gallinaceum]
MFIPQRLIVHYHHCSINNIGDIFIDYINVQLFFLKNFFNCSLIQFVEEIHPYSNNGSYPYAFNTLEGNVLHDTEIIDYMKNIYLFDLADYEMYIGLINELNIILIYYLWVDDNIYNNFTKKIYKDRFFYLYYIYLIRKLRKENLEKCQMRGLDNHKLNITRLKTILNILDETIGNSVNSTNRSDICYFHSVCFSVLSIFYSIPSKFNKELQAVLISRPNLIEFVKNINNKYKIWKNEKVFLSGINDVFFKSM